MPKIHILYYHQYFNTPDMGGSTRSYEIAKRLIKMGFDVSVVTTNRDVKSKRKTYQEEIEGIKVYWLNIPYSNQMGFLKRILSFLKYAIKSAVIGVRINPDLVFASSTPLTVALPSLYCSKRKRIPMIFEVRDLWPNVPIAMGIIKNRVIKYLAEYLEKIAYINSAHIIALSPDMKSFIVELGIQENKITVIPNAADISLFQEKKDNIISFRSTLNINEKDVVILYAGTFGNVNGCEYIIRLAERLQHNTEIKFLLVGEGKEKEQIIQIAKEMKLLNNNLFILPPVKKKEIPSFFRHSDLIISTIINIQALEANSANKVFDGLAAGRAVLINHGGWISKFLESANAGLQLSWNIDDAAAQLNELANNKELISQMGLNALKLAETQFNRDNLTNKIGEVINSVIKMQKPQL